MLSFKLLQKQQQLLQFEDREESFLQHEHSGRVYGYIITPGFPKKNWIRIYCNECRAFAYRKPTEEEQKYLASRD